MYIVFEEKGKYYVQNYDAEDMEVVYESISMYDAFREIERRMTEKKRPWNLEKDGTKNGFLIDMNIDGETYELFKVGGEVNGDPLILSHSKDIEDIFGELRSMYK